MGSQGPPSAVSEKAMRLSQITYKEPQESELKIEKYWIFMGLFAITHPP